MFNENTCPNCGAFTHEKYRCPYCNDLDINTIPEKLILTICTIISIGVLISVITLFL
jgi:RNA polymerase subunit RPABC4/transcription elongation factor Spt4